MTRHKPESPEAKKVELVVALVHSGQVHSVCEGEVLLFFLVEFFEADVATTLHVIVYRCYQLAHLLESFVEAAGFVFVLLLFLRGFLQA